MSRMIANAELLFDDPGDQRRGPHTGEKAIGGGTAVDQIGQPLPVGRFEKRRTPRALLFLQCGPALLLKGAEPGGDSRSRSFENNSDLAAAPSIMVQQDSMKSSCLAIGAIDFGLLLAVNQFLVRLGVEMKRTRLHARPYIMAYLHLSACLVIYVRRYSRPQPKKASVLGSGTAV